MKIKFLEFVNAPDDMEPSDWARFNATARKKGNFDLTIEPKITAPSLTESGEIRVIYTTEDKKQAEAEQVTKAFEKFAASDESIEELDMAWIEV